MSRIIRKRVILTKFSLEVLQRLNDISKETGYSIVISVKDKEAHYAIVENDLLTEERLGKDDEEVMFKLVGLL